MFGLGFGEIFIVALLAFILIGPKQLPNIMKKLGVFMKEIIKVKEEFKKNVDQDDSLRSIRDSVHEIRQNVQDKVDHIRSEVTSSVEKENKNSDLKTAKE